MKMEIKRVPISEVEVWDKNPRNIKTKDFERLKRQIQELGVYKPLICVKENGKYTTLGGNMRLRVLVALNLKEVDISLVKAPDEATKIKYALSDNDRVGQYNEQALAELTFPHIEEINLEDYRIDVGEPISLKDVIEDYGPDIDGEDEIPEIDDSPAITKMGDLFTLGKHRLLCGDATKERDVKRLMGGEKANLLITDPPYGINYLPETESLKSKGHLVSDKIYPKQFDEFANWLNKLLDLTIAQLKKGACYYVWMSWQYLGVIERYFRLKGHHPNHCVIWNRVMPRMTSYPQDFLPNAEFCLYGWIRGEKRINNNILDGMRTSIWTVQRLKANEMEHTTQKPLKLATNAIRMSSKSNQIILDICLGSGWTLIASEKLNRICYGMEIEPKYCDVIITRYSNFAGIPEEEIRATRENG